ncbi:MAG: hypothetical protein JXA03_15920 [Bacteroidales bacterium]|nr:hypothetical protein [Bacteroidales bacterium]
MNTKPHIIHRFNLEFDVPDMESAGEVRERALLQLNHDVLPRLENWLDRFIPANVYLRFDHIDLILDDIQRKDFELEFSEKTLRALQQKIARHAGQPDDDAATEPFLTLSEGERMAETFFYFLDTGRLPWWSEKNGAILKNNNLLMDSLKRSPDVVSRMNELFQRNRNAVERLLLQFRPNVGIYILSILIERHNGPDANKVKSLITSSLKETEGSAEKSSSTLHFKLLREIFSIILDENRKLTQEKIHDILLKVKNKVLAKDGRIKDNQKGLRSAQNIENKDQEVKDRKEDEVDIFVGHAGLVILHPFLEYFYKEFDLLEKGNFKNDTSKILAVHLLNYLATGLENPPEFDLVFEKYLCGMEIESPVVRDIALSQSMKIESENLLNAVIGHWNILKNTSPNGLREGFLQRDGKLILNEFQPRIIVEGKSHDVLLDYLPWGYGVIKLPWLKKPLYVDWYE